MSAIEIEELCWRYIEDGNYRKAKDCIINGANTDKLLDSGISIIHLLSGREGTENNKLLDLCLENGASPNVPTFEGITPVHLASIWGLHENFCTLLKYHGDPEITDADGLNALDYALKSDDPNNNLCLEHLQAIMIESSFAKSNTYTSNQEENNTNDSNNALQNDGKYCHSIQNQTFVIDKSEAYNSSKTHSTTFHTAIEGDMTLTGGLDDTVVSFPKLHPWTVTSSDADLDDTVVDLGRYLKESPSKDHYHDDSSNITILYDWKEYSILEASCCENPNSTLIIPESLMAMSCQQVKAELLALGEDPGPVRADTRMLYVRRIARLKNGQDECQMSDKLKEYLPEVRAIIEGRLPSPEMDPAEESMCVEFTEKTLRGKWREGTEKSSFNYLLLDPRVTQNLPVRRKQLEYEDLFHTFVAAVFYVGKGKRSRPYAHLHEAAKKNKDSRKLNQIRDIWSAGLGVVSLHVFQGVIPVEAYTREACMIDALGLSRLTNKKRGDYYGRAKSWSPKKKREMGVYLIKRALQIFLNEGERQMKPEDLKKNP